MTSSASIPSAAGGGVHEPRREPRRKLLRAGACLPGVTMPGAILANATTAKAAPAVATSPTPSAPSLLRYRLAFADDFDDADLSRFNEDGLGGHPGAPAWRTRYRHPRKDFINGEKQMYMDPRYAGTGAAALGIQPLSIADGVLAIRAERADPLRVQPLIYGQRYTSGCITSQMSHWQTYGYFEMRARMPVGRGLWPAFWMVGKRVAWPPELDIVEAAGHRPGEAHVGVIDAQPVSPGSVSTWRKLPSIQPGKFSTYAMEWTRERIAFFVDGQRIHEYRGHRVHEDMYLIANLAVGSKDRNWIPDPDETTPFPAKFEIDYIHAYRID